MSAKLPPFKNGEHNSESVCTLDRDITPLTSLQQIVLHEACDFII